MAFVNKEQNQHQADNEQPVASIIVPAYNSKRTIRQCLSSLLAQQTAHSYEVILVDSSKDETPQIAREEFPQVRLIHLEQQTYPGSARNLGIRHARGKILAFMDSDCVADPDWLERIIAAHAQLDAAAIFGAVRNGTPTSVIGTVCYLIEFNEFLPRAKPRYTDILLGGNVGYKQEIFSKHNIFFTDIFPSEDTIFAWTLRQKREKIYFDPGILVAHLNRTSFSGLLRHQHTLGKASAEARRTTNLRGQIFVKYPWLCLGLPLARWARAALRLLRTDLKYFWVFLALTPLYLIASSAWSFGFISKGSFTPTRIQIEPSRAGT
jgi:glycosyltransferase involved in cell wall biosynthesis